jgi:glycosyltransferase involved in cell wall biosynthesis
LKILFINKYDISGGAGIAAFRLSQSLEEYFKTEYYFLAGIKKSNLPNVFSTRKPGLENFIERIINFLFNQVGLQYKFLPFSTRRIRQLTKEIEPDIISLHNAHGGYFETSLLQEISKVAPIVWTLHDMWAFTANAAHTFGDNSWKELKKGKKENKHFPQIGLNTGNWLLKKKKKIYNKSNLSVVCPSEWMFNQAKQSPLFTNKKIYHIPNGIDLRVFKKYDNSDTRKRFNIPDKSIVLAFAAEKGMQSEFKGGDDLIKILNGINANATEIIHLIIMGLGNYAKLDKFSNFIIHRTGYIFSEEAIAKYLSAADIFIYPTRADNLPSTLIESLACETPAITFDIGGCGEIVKDNYNGYLIEPFDIEKFISQTMELLKDRTKLGKLGENGRQSVLDKYSIRTMAQKYYNLFLELKKK